MIFTLTTMDVAQPFQSQAFLKTNQIKNQNSAKKTLLKDSTQVSTCQIEDLAIRI